MAQILAVIGFTAILLAVLIIAIIKAPRPSAQAALPPETAPITDSPAPKQTLLPDKPEADS